MQTLITEIRACTVCDEFLPHRPRPVIQVSEKSKIAIIGQAPGRKVHESGIPWDDASGNELRRWLGVTTEQFYDDKIFALVPMGFCYPGKGKSGDLPPRPECAPLWHDPVLSKIKGMKLTILIGQYAQKYYLGANFKTNITENVMNFRDFMPSFLPLVHPSPRNRIWQRKNPWFEEEVIPYLQKMIKEVF